MLSPFRKLNFKRVDAGVIVLTFAYIPGVLLTTVWSDEYPAIINPQGLSQELMEALRPVWSILALGTFTLLGTPHLLWLGRLLGFFGIVILYLSMVKFATRVTRTRSTELFIAFALCLPSFQNWAHWANAWPQSWAAVLSLWAFYFFKNQSLLLKIYAVSMLAIAVTTYPPSSVFFFGALVLWVYENDIENRQFFIEVKNALKLLVFAATLAYAISLFLLKILGLQKAPRASFLSPGDIVEKISWILTRPLVVGLQFYSINSPTIIFAIITSIPVVAIILFSLSRQAALLQENKLLRILLYVTCLGMTISPLILTTDNQIEHRYISGYAFAVFCLFFLSLQNIQTKLAKILLVKIKFHFIQYIFFSLFALAVIANTNWRYYESFYHPYQVKTSFLNSALANCDSTSQSRGIEIIPPKKGFVALARLGTYSQTTDLASDWVPIPNIQLLLPLSKRNIYDIHYPGDLNSSTNCVIDLESLRKKLR
jgi:hypothetical protein